jgi:hypothetical protein
MALFIKNSMISYTVRRLTVKKSTVQAVFSYHGTSFLLAFYFLLKISAKIPSLNVKSSLNSYKNRKTICQKQLHQSHFCWSWDYLHAPIHHLQLAQHLSQSPLRLSQFHKNCKPNKNQILLRIVSASPLIKCGGAQC